MSVRTVAACVCFVLGFSLTAAAQGKNDKASNTKADAKKNDKASDTKAKAKKGKEEAVTQKVSPESDRNAAATVKAGSAEDLAFRALKAESNVDKQAAVGLEFERNFPKSLFLPSVHTILAGVYLQKNDPKGMIEYGEKAYKANSQNIGALLALSRGYALAEERDIEKAQKFALLAVSVLEDLQSKPPQGGFTAQQWKAWLKQNDDSVKPWADYVKLLQPEPAKQTDGENTPDSAALR